MKMALVHVPMTTLLFTLLLAPVTVVLTQSGLGELCPNGRDKQELKNAVVDAACNYSRSDLKSELDRFKSDTRLRHSGPGPSKYVVCIPICKELRTRMRRYFLWFLAKLCRRSTATLHVLLTDVVA